MIAAVMTLCLCGEIPALDDMGQAVLKVSLV